MTVQTVTTGGVHSFLATLNVVVNVTTIVAVLTVKRKDGTDVGTGVTRVNDGVVVVSPNTSVENNIQRSTSSVRALGRTSCRDVGRSYGCVDTVSPAMGDSKR